MALVICSCYVKQKAFKLKEAVKVYADEGQTNLLYTIGADRMIDFSAEYHIRDAAGQTLGMVKRRGMRSLWRAQYEVSRSGTVVFTIQEENPWVKLVNGLIGEIPIIGMFTVTCFTRRTLSPARPVRAHCES